MVDENLEDLIARVRQTGADLGVAFDGDADRIGAVDDRGRIVRGDVLPAALRARHARTDPGAKVVFDVKCSQALPEVLAQARGRADHVGPPGTR